MTVEEKGDRGGAEVITQLEVAVGAQLSGVGPIWLYSQCLFFCAGGWEVLGVTSGPGEIS